MALIITNAGEGIFLANMLKKQAGYDYTVRLFSNNVTPSATSVSGDFIEVAGGGYSTQALTAGTWGITGTNPTTASYGATISFTFTGAPSTNSGYVYGYYVTVTTAGADSGVDVWGDRFTNAPIIIANNGDEIRITTLTIGLNNASE
jgi:hypothetical protein